MDYIDRIDLDVGAFHPAAIDTARHEPNLVSTPHSSDVHVDHANANANANASVSAAADGDGDGSANANIEKPYHSKRPHKKSRAGCTNCKKRKVKCNEERPACQACTLRQETCVYPTTLTSRKAPWKAATAGASPAKTSASSSPSLSWSSSPSTTSDRDPFQSGMVSEPLYCPAPMADAIDMKMLWFWTAATYGSFSIESGRSAHIDQVLKFRVVEHAFRSPFLMDCLMALSALKMQSLNLELPRHRVLAYKARAFAGYRQAIEAANPDDFPALLACSLLMTALSSQAFRDGDLKPLYVLDWAQVWKGIGLIVEIISPESIRESGLAVIFYRPPVNIEKSSRHIPNNLLFMVMSIGLGDADYAHQQTYYETLQYLGSLYLELNHGFGPMLDLRTITWFTFIPRDFIPLAKMHHPRALVILAYYLCFAKINQTVWWMQGIADPEIDHVCEIMDAAWGGAWDHLLRIPRRVRRAEGRLEIARILTENGDWAPEEEDLYERHLSGAVKYDLVSPLPVQDIISCRPNGTNNEPPQQSPPPPPPPPPELGHGDTTAQGLLLEKMMQVDPTISLEAPPRVTVFFDLMDSPESSASRAAQSYVSTASPDV
ncbi:hypothetical protein SLS62_005085 [Diatrype stigma]|uniref:Zn(2)-C6 fungal-type domain-containing protein n=1 Tax=Diatrype stigma TaxID=117547 RepID=A0AAN9UT65_9PEZI